jgi:hypothetical protein
MTGPPRVGAELADLGVSVAGHELPLIASLEPRGVVLWSSIRVATAVLAAVRVQAGPPRRWHVYGLAASPAGWGAEPASGVSSRYLIS